MGGAEPLGDDLRGEGLGAQAGKLGPELDDERLVEGERLEQLELHR